MRRGLLTAASIAREYGAGVVGADEVGVGVEGGAGSCAVSVVESIDHYISASLK
jgi:hypothetical protein